jgi:hypothetical protein
LPANAIDTRQIGTFDPTQKQGFADAGLRRNFPVALRRRALLQQGLCRFDPDVLQLARIRGADTFEVQ